MFLHWKKRKPSQRRVLVIGPTNAGKTTILGALSVASKYADRFGASIKCLNDPMREIAKDAEQGLGQLQSSLDATTSVTEYSFMLENRNTGFCTTIAEGDYRQAIFTVLDGPGGALMRDPQMDGADAWGGHEEDGIRKTILEKAAQSEAIVLCVDSVDEQTTGTFFVSLIRCLHDLGEPLPFRRFVVLLTKADRFFADYGAKAHGRAANMNPWPRAWRLLSKHATAQLWGHCDPRVTELSCGWISAYGFSPTDGQKSRSYDQTHWLDAPENRRIDRWRPFNLFDPFVYLSDGGSDSLWIHRNYRRT